MSTFKWPDCGLRKDWKGNNLGFFANMIVEMSEESYAEFIRSGEEEDIWTAADYFPNICAFIADLE